MKEYVYAFDPDMPENELQAFQEERDAHESRVFAKARDALSHERCKAVRRWRCDCGLSWRAVASSAAEEWPEWTDTDQIAGMVLCKVAAGVLGEDPNKEPWN